MADPDLYVALGVPRGASDDEIRKAYRKLARRTHPDVNPNDPKAEERFKRVSFAYEVLADPEKRKLYNEFGADGLAQGFDPEHARAYARWSRGAQRSPSSGAFSGGLGLEDLVSELFGRGGRPRGPRRGADVEGEIRVDFLAAVRGDEARVELPGRGVLRVRIPPGADEGTRIRLAGKGEPGPGGGPAGDLYLVLRVRPHRFFRREGADLRLELPVTLPELIRGGSVEVPTPDGPVKMTVPPRSANGAKLRLRGKGARRRGSGERGDLLVQLVVQLPESEDSRLDEIAADLEPLYAGQDLRKHLRDES